MLIYLQRAILALVLFVPCMGCFPVEVGPERTPDMASAPVKRAVAEAPADTLLLSGRIVDGSGRGLAGISVWVVLGKIPPPSRSPRNAVRKVSYTVKTGPDGDYSVRIKRYGMSHFHVQYSSVAPYFPTVSTREFAFPAVGPLELEDEVFQEGTKAAVRALLMKQLKLKEADMWKYEARLRQIYRKMRLRR